MSHLQKPSGIVVSAWHKKLPDGSMPNIYLKPYDDKWHFVPYDAGYVYDYLRHKHPERADDWLIVRCVPPSELNRDMIRAVAVRRMDLSKFKTARGLAPVTEITYIGERPKVPAGSIGCQIGLHGTEEEDSAALLNMFQMLESVFGEAGMTNYEGVK